MEFLLPTAYNPFPVLEVLFAEEKCLVGALSPLLFDNSINIAYICIYMNCIKMKYIFKKFYYIRFPHDPFNGP